jgi:RNA polymerase sigma factor (sigma-70 family)
MNDSRSDSALVAAHLGGDQSALADIYDRHGAALYDTAAAMLHDRDEAADVVQDVFTIALQRLHQLRQPERLRPWLFAILRNEVYRSTRRRSRQRPTDFTTAAKAMADTGQTDDSGSMDVVALAAAVRAAVAGLDRRDQMILELSSRQGLDGDDLADALGVSRQQCHVLVHRMRQRVSRSLGALTVARMGRADCERLGTILRGWDGTFSVQVRKRVAAHVDDCSTCQTTQQRFTVVSLMGLAPALVAPAALRDTVLRSAASSRASTVRPGKTEPSTGFPRSGSRRNLRVAGVVTAVMVVLTALFWVAGRGPLASSTRDSDTTRPTIVTTTAVATTTPAAITTTETTAATTSATTTSATTTADTTTTVGPTSEPTTTPQPTTSELPPPPPPAPGRLQLSTSDIDLGATATQASLTLRNAGGQPIDWQVIGETAPLVWSATEGALAAGESRDVQLGIDRSAQAEGPVDIAVSIASSNGDSGALVVRATVERPPVVELARAVSTITCPWSVDPTVAATVTDENAIVSVMLSWEGPGAPGAATMTNRSGTGWSGRLAIEQVSGEWRWTITATDSRGNTGTTSGTLTVTGRC